MAAAGRPESPEQILEAAVASLTEADIPPADQDGWLDPDADPPAGLAALPDAELAALLAAAPSRPAPPAWPLSYPHPDRPGGPEWPAGPGRRIPAARGSPTAALDPGRGASAVPDLLAPVLGSRAVRGPGSPRAGRWTNWRPACRWPGWPTTRTRRRTRWMMTA